MGRSINYQNQNRKKGLHIVVIVVVAVVALSQLGTNGINGLALPCKLAPMNHNRCDTTTQLFSALHAVHHNGKGLQQRRAFIQKSILGGVAAATTAMKFNSAASAATPAVPSTSSSSSSKKKMPTIYTTEKGVKYVITKDAPSGSKTPQSGDIVAVEYTGYLTSEQVR